MLSMLITAVLVSVSGSQSTTHDYHQAYRECERNGKPLMVVVGAQWCHACNVLKDTTLKQMEAAGQLEDVNIALVDRDVEPQLADRLMRGQMVPQIIVFSKGPSGRWERSQLTGFQGQGPVRQLILSAKSVLRRS